MKTKFLALLPCFFLSFFIHAQNVKPVNSGELISQGIQLHDQKKYKDAIELFRKIPRNDTNYVRGLYELAYTLTADSNFSEALTTCDLGLANDESDYELEFRLLKASIIDDSGDNKKALQLYDSILMKYSNSQSVLLNKAISLIRLERKEEAQNVLEDLLIRNPYYASAHFRLGQLALQKGQVVQAMMCFYTYLLIAPAGSYSSSCINLLAGISKVTDDAAEYIAKRTWMPEGNFALVEQIVTSKIALDKNYKVLTSLDDPIIRQLQVIMEKLQYEPDNSDFFMQFYVPYMKDIFEKKLFEPAIYTAFSDVKIDKIQDYIKKNSKEMSKAADAINAQFSLIRTTRELNYSKRVSLSPTYHFDDGVLIGKGKLIGNDPDGQWEFYFKNGNTKAKGLFVNGKKEGKWTYYYDNGTLSGYDNWSNGLQNGEDLTYSKQGVLVTRANFLNGKMNGEKTRYFAVGHPFSITTYVNGAETGPYKQFFASGRKKIEAVSENDQLDGLYRSFFENGKNNVVANYVKGKLNGAYKSYYNNGQLEFEGNYQNDELQGEAKTYYRNAKLKHVATYNNGLIEGDELSYNDEGVLTDKIPYKNGKADGVAEYRDDDGKLYCTFQFENNKLKIAKYFDKAGNLISTSLRQNKLIELTNYTPEGYKSGFMIYNDKAEKQGTDSFYYKSGKLKEVNFYSNGLLSGITTGYYPNGNKQYEVNYENDKRNGLNRNYYVNGAIQSEGWYVDGDLNGDWIDYNEKGNITFKGTYLNNDLYGTRQSFFANGKLDDEEDYKSGWRTALRQYDTSGKLINTVKIVNGNGQYKGVYPNGAKRYEGTIVQGEFNGPFTNYFPNGTIQVSKNYDHGLLNGGYKDYFFGGQLANEGNYDFDKKSGVWKAYYADGKISREETYDDGELNGMTVDYFDNGKVERELNYKNGLRNGISKRYSYDGQLAAVFYYKDDILISYAYNDKNGQLITPIPLKAGTGKLVTYYANGNKSTEMEYADGKLTGSYKLYFSNGKIYFDEQGLIYGLVNGKTTEYYSNGNVKSTYNYFLDNQDGPYKEFYEDGKLKEEGNFYNGYLNGVRKLYDASGKLTARLDYYYGLILNISK